MKNRLRLVLICLMLCMFSGCTFSNAGIEAILKAPKISDEQSQIYQALIDSTGKNIQLKYPLSGDNRSSFVITNIDSESTNEAIVFYKKVGASTAESNIRINILDQFEGKWRSVYDISEVGEEVDRVIVSYLGESKVPYLIV